LAEDFLAVDFFAELFFAVDFLAVDFLAVDFLAVDFLAVDLLAEDFLAEDFFAELFFAVDFLAVDFLAVDFLAAGMFTSFQRSRRHALQASSFPFAHAAPHAVALVPAQGVVQALDPNGALGADPLRLSRGSALLGEEDLGIELAAAGPVLPWNEVMHRRFLPELHPCNSGPRRRQKASPNRGGRARTSPPASSPCIVASESR
jgi:hypothetical protein